jgi:hypothetical protein
MKRVLVILCLGLLLLNCNSKAVEKPDNLLTENQMVNILYDLYVVNAMKSTNYQYLTERGITASAYVYDKYDIDSLQFATSDKYYASDLEEYEKIYMQVANRLQKSKAEVDTLLMKNPEDALKVNVVKPNVTPFNKDSIRRKRPLEKVLFNDGTKN